MHGKDANSAAPPFCDALGLSLLDPSGERAAVVLPDAPHLKNHIGTHHAGAIFAAAEVAWDLLPGDGPQEDVTVEISYLKLPEGDVTATAGVAGSSAHVTLTDERGRTVAEVDVRAAVRTQPAP